MTSISILGSGSMARGIGTRALAGGNDVQILDRERLAGGTRGMRGQLQRVVSCEDVIRSMMRWRRFATAHRTTVER
ncbi:MAG TPA: hypothetical protein VK585_05115 [Jiangellaceae bacterium]|nr:hypothetical protein [Jiangellaceae bacterium]